MFPNSSNFVNLLNSFITCAINFTSLNMSILKPPDLFHSGLVVLTPGAQLSSRHLPSLLSRQFFHFSPGLNNLCPNIESSFFLVYSFILVGYLLEQLHERGCMRGKFETLHMWKKPLVYCHTWKFGCIIN